MLRKSQENSIQFLESFFVKTAEKLEKVDVQYFVGSIYVNERNQRMLNLHINDSS